MKKLTAKLVLFTSLFALAGMFVTPAVRAQDEASTKPVKTETKSKRAPKTAKKKDQKGKPRVGNVSPR